jgi:hypothetical protein
MNDESLSRREELINSIREASSQNTETLNSRISPKPYMEGEKEHSLPKNTFAIRFIICLVLFIGFYYLRETKASIFQVTSDKIIKEVSKGVEADEVISRVTKWITKETTQNSK